MRLTLLAATASALVAGTHAPSALASDGIEPIAPPATIEAEIASAVPAVEASVPEVEVPPVVVRTATTEDAIDVSVRVLSPGNDSTQTPDNTATDVIPPALPADITADPAPDANPADRIGTAASSRLNTNVSVRVLSPGDNGLVSQEDVSVTAPETAAGGQGAQPAAPDEAPSRDDRTRTENDSTQYHEKNSRYQSGWILVDDSWSWTWYLTLDCTGITSSIVKEIGSPASDDWAWNWDWTWDCGLDGASEAAAAALEEGVPYTISSTSSTPSAEEPSSGSDQLSAAEESWIWTWTFTFCGRETAISLRTQTELALRWTWDWTWTWACTAAATTGTGSVSSPSGPSAEPATTPWLVTATGGEGATMAAAGSSALELPPPFVALVPWLLPEIPLVGEGIPSAVSPAPEEAEPSAAPVVSPARPVSKDPEATSPPPAAADVTTTSPGTPRSKDARPTRSTRHDDADRRPARVPRTPLDSPRRVAGGSSSSSGTAPGGVGVAALTGLYVLTAPGLGRPVRIARELSPRDPHRAPLDRPG